MADAEHPRDRLFRLGARSLRKILTLQDRNPHSPTYGCFDRKFWHLRVTDFPSGMAQELVLPLALAYSYAFPDNSFKGAPALREWTRAGIAYAMNSAHSDGSCDDYFPFEKAAGATAFSLYAILEALKITSIDDRPFLPFLERRARWLGNHEESGRLSNHEALIANALLRVGRRTGKKEFFDAARTKIDRLRGWQNPEGWFFEYQGADPGYLTLTIASLAEIDAEHPELELRAPIMHAVHFLHALQPPDGWLGGEWTSRNTNNFFPHGLEICGTWLEQALQVNDRAIEALGNAPEYDDDTIIGHHCWSYLKAALEWKEVRPAAARSSPCYFPQAGYVVLQKDRLTLLVAMKKGGAFRLYRDNELVHSDTGLSALVQSRGRLQNLVSHLWSENNEITVTQDSVTVIGPMGFAKSAQMTPMKSMLLRVLMLSVGRLYPDLVRRALQRLLITGAPRSPLRFMRRLILDESRLQIEDTINGKASILDVGAGPAQTSIYTVMSRVYHFPQLQPWNDLSSDIRNGQDPCFQAVRQIEALS